MRIDSSEPPKEDAGLACGQVARSMSRVGLRAGSPGEADKVAARDRGVVAPGRPKSPSQPWIYRGRRARWYLPEHRSHQSTLRSRAGRWLRTDVDGGLTRNHLRRQGRQLLDHQLAQILLLQFGLCHPRLPLQAGSTVSDCLRHCGTRKSLRRPSCAICRKHTQESGRLPQLCRSTWVRGATVEVHNRSSRGALHGPYLSERDILKCVLQFSGFYDTLTGR